MQNPRDSGLEGIIQNTYKQRTVGEELGDGWKKIDRFGVSKLASTKFVKCFYVTFGIGVIFFLMALILFLIPVKSDYKDRENELEESISNWEYKKNFAHFEKAKFTLLYDTTSFQASNPHLKLVHDYNYPLDNYIPIYDEKFHVYDHSLHKSQLKNTETFTFNEDFTEIPKYYLQEECIKFQSTYEKTTADITEMPVCKSTNGLKFVYATQQIQDYTVKCSQINEKDCQMSCRGNLGILKTTGEKQYQCITLKVARMLCISVKNNDEKFSYEKNCFSKNQMAYYTQVMPDEQVNLRDLIVMVRDYRDPYIKAYQLSIDGHTFYNLNVDNPQSKTIKWLIFLSGLIFVSLFFLHAIFSLANENEIMKHNLQQRSLSYFLGR